jgi:hypothetical protein
MSIRHWAAAAVLVSATLPAAAVDFTFYKLGRGAVSDVLPTDGIVCTGSDRCSSNVDGSVFGGDLTFVSGGITAVATASYTGGASAVVQDATGNWTFANSAGLGVYHSKITSDDNITFGETLTITFDRVVTLTDILLRAEGHNFTSWSTGSTFLFNGAQMLLPDNVGTISGLSVTGSVFTFAFDDNRLQTGDQFYVAGLTVVPVPEPETYVLMLAGLAALGAVSRRRRPRQTRAG